VTFTEEHAHSSVPPKLSEIDLIVCLTAVSGIPISSGEAVAYRERDLPSLNFQLPRSRSSPWYRFAALVETVDREVGGAGIDNFVEGVEVADGGERVGVRGMRSLKRKSLRLMGDRSMGKKEHMKGGDTEGRTIRSCRERLGRWGRNDGTSETWGSRWKQ